MPNTRLSPSGARTELNRGGLLLISLFRQSFFPKWFKAGDSRPGRYKSPVHLLILRVIFRPSFKRAVASLLTLWQVPGILGKATRGLSEPADLGHRPSKPGLRLLPEKVPKRNLANSDLQFRQFIHLHQERERPVRVQVARDSALFSFQ